ISRRSGVVGEIASGRKSSEKVLPLFPAIVVAFQRIKFQAVAFAFRFFTLLAPPPLISANFVYCLISSIHCWNSGDSGSPGVNCFGRLTPAFLAALRRRRRTRSNGIGNANMPAPTNLL